MNKEEQIKAAYTSMYEGMIRKDEKILDEVLSEDFVLVHMTGMRQNKKEFIKAVMNGTLNYYSARHDSIKIYEDKDAIDLVGKTYVLAAVFGGGRNYWHLRQDCKVAFNGTRYQIAFSKAGTY